MAVRGLVARLHFKGPNVVPAQLASLLHLPDSPDGSHHAAGDIVTRLGRATEHAWQYGKWSTDLIAYRDVPPDDALAPALAIVADLSLEIREYLQTHPRDQAWVGVWYSPEAGHGSFDLSPETVELLKQAGLTLRCHFSA